MDEYLKKMGLKYEDLSPTEKETYHQMEQQMKASVLTTELFRDYIKQMRYGVEVELANHNNGKIQDIFLKARLRNYILMEAFLDTPERAKKALEQASKGVSR